MITTRDARKRAGPQAGPKILKIKRAGPGLKKRFYLTISIFSGYKFYHNFILKFYLQIKLCLKFCMLYYFQNNNS